MTREQEKAAGSAETKKVQPQTAAGTEFFTGGREVKGTDPEKSKPPILEVRNLTKAFSNSGTYKGVLENMNLKVADHEFLSILGPSGCGKTTLLRCIAGFEPYEGDVLVNGKVTRGPGTDRIMVFQDFNQLFPWKTVEKNIQYALKLQGMRDKDALRDAVGKALSVVKLDGYGKYYPYQLSGGMKQRVAIAKALALKPSIILMDEPFAALDAMTRNTLQEELLNIYEQEKCTIIFITHNIQEGVVLGTRLMVLQDKGHILVDEKNRIPRPVSPSSPGYGAYWDMLHEALYKGAPETQL